jgi:hypothetical protein
MSEKDAKQNQWINLKQSLTCLIHAFSLMQMQGAGTRRHSYLFQGFRNEADALK